MHVILTTPLEQFENYIFFTFYTDSLFRYYIYFIDLLIYWTGFFHFVWAIQGLKYSMWIPFSFEYFIVVNKVINSYFLSDIWNDLVPNHRYYRHFIVYLAKQLDFFVHELQIPYLKKYHFSDIQSSLLIVSSYPYGYVGKTTSWVWKFHGCVVNYTVSIVLILLLISFFILAMIINILLLTNKLLPNYYQLLFVKYFEIIEQIIRDLIINRYGKKYYYSFFIFLFIFINLCNLHSLIPYSYAITSNFSYTFTLSFLFFLTLNLTGIFYHGIFLLNLFFPSGTPFLILPLLILIEFISYIARMFSLAIRLFANITAGHILLKILSWFAYLLYKIFFIAIIISLVISCLWILEFFISILQAYVFLILLCIYVNEVLQLH